MRVGVIGLSERTIGIYKAEVADGESYEALTKDLLKVFFFFVKLNVHLHLVQIKFRCPAVYRMRRRIKTRICRVRAPRSSTFGPLCMARVIF